MWLSFSNGVTILLSWIPRYDRCNGKHRQNVKGCFVEVFELSVNTGLYHYRLFTWYDDATRRSRDIIFLLFNGYVKSVLENTKTTSMKNARTGVLEKNKEHYLRIKDKAEKWYDVSRHMQLHMSKYKKWRYTMSCFLTAWLQLPLNIRFAYFIHTCEWCSIGFSFRQSCFLLPYRKSL